MASVCPRPLACSTDYGTLTIDGWSLHTPAWCAWDLSELLSSPAHKGGNVPVERLAGFRARPQLPAETTYSVPLMFSGATDRTGTPHADGSAGLLTNRWALEEHLVTPIRNGTATLAATLTVPGVGVLTADVQPLRLGFELQPGGYARGVLVLQVPTGGFTA